MGKIKQIPEHHQYHTSLFANRRKHSTNLKTTLTSTLLITLGCLLHRTATLTPVSAFTTKTPIQSVALHQNKNQSLQDISLNYVASQLPVSLTSKALQMSSLGREPEDSTNNEKNKQKLKEQIKAWINSKLPAPPEDQLSMSGDVAAIFLYSFLDHTINGMYDSMLNAPPEVISGVGPALLAIQASTADYAEISGLDLGASSGSLPVWFETSSSAPFGPVPLTSALPLEHHITYAPVISTAGMSATLLASTWLFCGYFTGIFQFKNTLQCSTRHAISMTALNWMFTCIIMTSLAYGSDVLVGHIDSLHKSVGLTRADVDYIFDSLSVLIMWKFLLSSMLGYSDDR